MEVYVAIAAVALMRVLVALYAVRMEL